MVSERERRSKSLGMDPTKVTRQDALKALSIRKGQIAEGKFNIAQTKTPILFEKLTDRYLEYSQANKRAWQRDRQSIGHLLVYFKGKALSQVTHWLVEKYKTERRKSVKPSTINRELDTLRHMLNMAVAWKMVDSSPYKGVKHFRVSNTNLRIVTNEEFHRLYTVASHDLKPILLTAITTGIMKGRNLKSQMGRRKFRRRIYQGSCQLN
jgi:hypothetical protein